MIFLCDYSPCGFEGDFIVSSVLCFHVTNDAAHLFICLWTNFTSLEKCSSDPLSFCKWDGFSFFSIELHEVFIAIMYWGWGNRIG